MAMDKWTGDHNVDSGRKYANPGAYVGEVITGNQRPDEWTEMSRLVAQSGVSTLSQIGAVSSENIKAVLSAIESAVGSVANQIRSAQEAKGAAWLDKENKGDLNKIRTTCSETAMKALETKLGEIGISHESVANAVKNGIRVSAEVVGAMLTAEKVPFDSSLTERLGSKSGGGEDNSLDKVLAAIAPEGTYGLDYLQKMSKAEKVSGEELRAGATALVTANGAWFAVQPMRGLYEMKNPDDKLGGTDDLSPQTGAGRMDENVSKQYGSFPKMIRSVYEYALQKTGSEEAAFAYAMFAVTKDLKEVGKVFQVPEGGGF